MSPHSNTSPFPELPAHLAGHEAVGLRSREPVAQFELGNHRNFVYLVIDWDAGVAAIVDPQTDLGPPLAALKQHGLRLERILITHTHFDHIAGLGQLAHDFPGLPLHVHAEDEHRIAKELREKLKLQYAHDNDEIFLGQLKIRVMHTPGHSPGECSYAFTSAGDATYLLTGDTIFIRDCGRTDFEGGSNAQLFASLQRVKAELPPNTVILPGHHYQEECASTLAREKVESPPFRCADAKELEALP